MTSPQHSIHFATMLMLALVTSMVVSSHAVVFGQAAPSDEDRDTGIKLLKAGRTSDALSALQKATGKNKADAEAWYYLGVVYIKLKDFKKASASLEAAIKIRPELAEAHTALSFALLFRSKMSQAADEAEKSLAINPKTRTTPWE